MTKTPPEDIPPEKLRKVANESLVLAIGALLFTKIPIVYLLVPFIELYAAIRAGRADTKLVKQGQKRSWPAIVTVFLGGILFFVTGIMAAATVAEVIDKMNH